MAVATQSQAQMCGEEEPANLALLGWGGNLGMVITEDWLTLVYRLF